MHPHGTTLLFNYALKLAYRYANLFENCGFRSSHFDIIRFSLIRVE